MRRRSCRECAPGVRRPLSGSEAAVSSFRQRWLALFGSLYSNVSVLRILRRRKGMYGKRLYSQWFPVARYQTCQTEHSLSQNSSLEGQLGGCVTESTIDAGSPMGVSKQSCDEIWVGLFTMFSSSIVWVVARQVTGEYSIRARRENSRPATVSAVQLTIWRSKVNV